MSQADREHFERERLDADQRYNAALTEFDRVVTLVTSQATATREDVGRVTNALLVFLQQITAFVETKDRELVAGTAQRFDALTPALDAITELRVQVGVLQRATEMLKRSAGGPQSAIHNPQFAIASPESDDYKYLGFEDAFRGAGATIEERLRVYVPIFDGCSNVLDIGCGRGELLAALHHSGVSARGIDANSAMVAVARERGLDAQQADALAYVTSLPAGSLGGVVATQVIEHFEPSYLMRLVDAAADKLRPGAPIVLETINPACWLAFFSSYIRDFTHVRPVHPETLQYVLRASGFARVEIRYSAPVPEHMKMKTVDLPADVLGASDSPSKALAQIAHTLNANAVILNNLLFSYLDYAAIGYRS
jgi:2-polyprenyl-3-methyl-5-hydroxy-6-metoxy-1,4-benzoquinol methylase